LRFFDAFAAHEVRYPLTIVLLQQRHGGNGKNDAQ
jgi:hypothetical protein